MNVTRRQFTAALLAGAAWPTIAQGTATRSANELVRIGVIGTGVRGKYLIGNLPDFARVTAICDCAESRLTGTLRPQGLFAPVLQRFRDTDAGRCAAYQDYRRLLDRERLDAVIIAAPDHHHAYAGTLALQAGCDVYLEKPLTVTIREGRLLADMVRRTGRVLQVGSQQRTMEINRFACEFVRAGGLGKITHVDLPNYPGPIAEPDFPSESRPDGIDWEMFCGPAALRPYHRHLWMKEDYKVGNLLWRGWDLFRDYSGHLMTNWGAHSVDMVQYALGRDATGPVAVRLLDPEPIESVGRDYLDKTPPPAANERRFRPVEVRYADGITLRFVLGLEAIRFHGDKGILKMRRNHFETDPPGMAVDGPGDDVLEKWKGAGHVARPHLENWLAAIRDGAELNAPVEVGHRTATVCHLANIARELDRPLRWDPVRETFIDDPEADRLLERPRRKGFELPSL